MSARRWADHLFEWASERGAGDRETFFYAYRWARKHVEPFRAVTDRDVYRFLRTLSDLGMIETTFPRGRWSVAPAVITQLPNSDIGVVTGSRTPAFCVELRRAAELRSIELSTVAPEGSPEVILVRPSRARELEELAADASATFVPCAAAQIADVLPEIQPEVWPETWPPDPVEGEFQTFDPDLLQFMSTLSPPDRGLVRDSAYRPVRYLLADRDTWRAVPKAVGVYTELARHSRQVLSWSPRSGGELLVHSAAALPRLHARAAALCFGTPPELRGDGMLAYRNVPFHVAASICRTLLQPEPPGGTQRA